ncbi:MAG: metallophosphoesterase [Ferruginibacter sp.]|nr:metallophosphoesterase [Ferruginibacter sp.]
MRHFWLYFLKRPLRWIANNFSAAPKKEVVFKSLSDLLADSEKESEERIIILEADVVNAKFISFSDQHKGDICLADDFKNNDTNYVAALKYYNENNFSFIALGDTEELWKFTPQQILQANENSLAAEAAFQPERLFKTFGNHDIIWKNKLDLLFNLKKYFTMPLVVYEGMVIKLKTATSALRIFLTHGHQGDIMSDNNGFSTWIIAHLWMPLQRYLQINVNTPSSDYSLRNKHNIMMSEWSGAQKNLLLITGHTHVPVFASGKYFNHPSNNIPGKKQALLKPSYFNTGCCCFDDGDITGIEISDGFIRLIKWYDEENGCKRKVL